MTKVIWPGPGEGVSGKGAVVRYKQCLLSIFIIIDGERFSMDVCES